MRKTLLSGFTALALLGLAAADARAAFIIVDDANPNTVTITAGDFEFGFWVNGVELTTGISQSNSITLADGLHSFAAIWVTFGGDSVDSALVAGTPGVAGSATAGMLFSGVNDGITATVNGIIAGYTGAFYSVLGTPGFPQGVQLDGAVLAMGFTYIPELVAVPEPASLALFGCGLFGLALARRRRAAAAPDQLG